MIKTPLLIVCLLILLAFVGVVYVLNMPISGLTAADRLSGAIAIFACLGAFVSATFVVYSYFQTNLAFVESQRPQLLIQVENVSVKKDQESDELVPITRIHYRNITKNPFKDLTIALSISAANRTIDLGDMFRPKMTMIGLDARQRTISHISILTKRGMDIEELSRKGNEVILRISYTYTFRGARDMVEAQQYRWDSERREWSIV